MTGASRTGLRAVVAAWAAAAWSSGCSEPLQQSNPPWFAPVESRWGIAFDHLRNKEIGYLFPEIMGGGACLLDYDGDGDLDLYFVQSGELPANPGEGPFNRLFANEGKGRFRDVTEQAGVGDSSYGMGCTCGDYDGDRDVDLYVTNVGRDTLYRNDGGGRFTDVTEQAGVGDMGWGTSCAFLDYDQDEDLDLFVVNYIVWSTETELVCTNPIGQRDYCSPLSYNRPAPPTLYQNQGDGTFRDVSEEAGIHKAFGNGLGVVPGDFNRDGRIDVYVANDGMPNQLWINHGDGTFTNEALIAGCAVNRQGRAEAGMGVAAVDLDDNGYLDLYISHLQDETNTLYLNNGKSFSDATSLSGTAAPTIDRTGFGLGFHDFNHDGELDLYVCNGRVTWFEPVLSQVDRYAEPALLFRGLGGARFEEVVPEGGTAELLIANGRAAAFGDLDDDGAVDIVVVQNGGRACLLRNLRGGDGHWAMFRVLEKNGTDALFAQVTIACGERTQSRVVQVAYSYCAGNDPRVHFGLGACDRIDSVRVIWTDGEEESFGSMPANRLAVLRRGEGQR